jgi:hypothetical protein
MAQKHFTDEESRILREYVTSVRQELFTEPIPDDQHAELLFELEQRIRQHPIFQDHLKRIYSNFKKEVHEQEELLKQQAGIQTESQQKKQKAILKGIRRLVLFMSLLSGVFAGFAGSHQAYEFNLELSGMAFVFVWIQYFFIRFVLNGFRGDVESYFKALESFVFILKWIIILLFAGLIFYFAAGSYARIKRYESNPFTDGIRQETYQHGYSLCFEYPTEYRTCIRCGPIMQYI